MKTVVFVMALLLTACSFTKNVVKDCDGHTIKKERVRNPPAHWRITG